MKIQLSTSSFKLIEKGPNTLKIVEAKAVPSGKPQAIEIKFEDRNGTGMSATYRFNNDKAMFVLSLILRSFFGDITEFDTNMVGELVGEYLDVEIKHITKDSTQRPGETVIFANIGKVIGKGQPWEVDMDFEDDEELDFEGDDVEEINDEDLPF